MNWQFVTDMLGQYIGPIFNGEDVQERCLNRWIHECAEIVTHGWLTGKVTGARQGAVQCACLHGLAHQGSS